MGSTCSKTPPNTNKETTTQTTTTKVKQVTNDNENNMAPIASTLALGAGYVICFTYYLLLFILKLYSNDI
jgi:hypothetical protein